MLDSDFIVPGVTQTTGPRPRFFPGTKLNGFQSELQGREVHDDCDMVEILIPGDMRTRIEREVTEADKKRWPDHYKAYREGKKVAVQGTPLEAWSLVSPAQVRNLKANNIFTVEDLSGLSDAGIQNIGMGGLDLVRKANLWLKSAEGNSEISKVIADNRRLSTEVDDLKRQIGEIAAMKSKPADAPVAASADDMMARMEQMIEARLATPAAPSADVLREAELAIELSKANRRLAELEAEKAAKPKAKPGPKPKVAHPAEVEA